MVESESYRLLRIWTVFCALTSWHFKESKWLISGASFLQCFTPIFQQSWTSSFFRAWHSHLLIEGFYHLSYSIWLWICDFFTLKKSYISRAFFCSVTQSVDVVSQFIIQSSETLICTASSVNRRFCQTFLSFINPVGLVWLDFLAYQPL